jgi:hypothetical protein
MRGGVEVVPAKYEEEEEWLPKTCRDEIVWMTVVDLSSATASISLRVIKHSVQESGMTRAGYPLVILPTLDTKYWILKYGS